MRTAALAPTAAGGAVGGPAGARKRRLCTVALSSARKPVLPARTFDDLCEGLGRCRPPPQGLAERARRAIMVPLRFRQDGAIVGVPRTTFKAGVSTREDGESLFRTTVDAMRRRPEPTTPAHAGGFARHATVLRVVDEKP